MDNLHRDLAPISDEAWTEIEAEVRRTFQAHLAGRRVVDTEVHDGTLAAMGTGHLAPIDGPAAGVEAKVHRVRPVATLRIPFTLSREAIDDVALGSPDSDWQPAKDAARAMALAEDKVVFAGWEEVGIGGLQTGAETKLALPDAVTDYPDAVSHAVSTLRLAGVDGPFSLLLGAKAYTAVSETSDHGYPIAEHISRLLSGSVVWAPAIEGGVLLSTRGGDFALDLGQDLSIGYLDHDAATVTLFLQESLTFHLHSPEAAVALTC